MRIYELLEEMTPDEAATWRSKREQHKKYFLKKHPPQSRDPRTGRVMKFNSPNVSLDADRTRGNPHDAVSRAVQGSVKEAGSVNLGPLKGRIISQDDFKKLLNDFNEKNGHWPSIDETVELLLRYAGDDDVTVVGEDSSGGGSGGSGGGATAGATSAGSIATYASQVGIANVGPRGVGTGGKKTKKRKTGSKTPNPAGGLVPYGTVQ